MRRVPLTTALVLTALGAAMCLAEPNEKRDTRPIESAAPPAATAETPPPPQPNTRPYLGIDMGRVPASLSAHVAPLVGKRLGVLVTAVHTNSSAEKAGLRINDVLTRWGDQRLYNGDQLCGLIADNEPGRKVVLEVVRGGKLGEITVTLGQAAVVAPNRESLPERAPAGRGGEFVGASSVSTDAGSAAISTNDGRFFRVSVSFRDRTGREVKRTYEGSQAEILSQLRTLPVELEDAIRRRFERLQKRPAFDDDNRDWFEIDRESESASPARSVRDIATARPSIGRPAQGHREPHTIANRTATSATRVTSSSQPFDPLSRNARPSFDRDGNRSFWPMLIDKRIPARTSVR